MITQLQDLENAYMTGLMLDHVQETCEYVNTRLQELQDILNQESEVENG